MNARVFLLPCPQVGKQVPYTGNHGTISWFVQCLASIPGTMHGMVDSQLTFVGGREGEEKKEGSKEGKQERRKGSGGYRDAGRERGKPGQYSQRKASEKMGNKLLLRMKQNEIH